MSEGGRERGTKRKGGKEGEIGDRDKKGLEGGRDIVDRDRERGRDKEKGWERGRYIVDREREGGTKRKCGKERER